MDKISLTSSYRKYKNFKETYSLCSFSLAIALIYPNRTNTGSRLIILLFLNILNGVQLFWFLVYTYKCFYALDIYNVSRNMTMFVIVLLYFIKTFYCIYATNEFANLLDKISQDLVKANFLNEDDQMIYDEYIKKGKIGEISWLLIPTALSAQFPIYAGICMSIESIRTDDFPRRMVHDMELLFFEDIQNEAPFFHCMFVYNCIQCVVLVPNYTGLDGSFCIATSHLCLKLKLMTNKVRKAFQHSKNHIQLRRILSDAIREHQDALEFYKQIQNVYGPWLFAVFLVTSIIISFNLYQLYLLKRVDPKYTMFGLMGVLHIYLPCYYASTLIKVGEDISSELYAAPWEKWLDPKVTRMLTFMIVQAQEPLILTGSGLVIFNMDLFKSILQTSYSFFTLISA